MLKLTTATGLLLGIGVGIALLLRGATSYYVSPSGSGTACSEIAPCSFPYIIAANNAKGVVGGDTVFLRGGTYTGSFIVEISGTSTNSILFRNYPNEAVVLDNAMDVDPATLGIISNYVTFQGFDGPTKSIRVTNSSTTRIVIPHLDCYPLCRAEGVLVTGINVKLIHLILDNNGQGGVSQSTGQGLVLYGNIIAYNGWQSSSRGHGHGVYLQNDSLTNRKRIENNIVFWNFGYGAQIYGSSGANVYGIDYVGNVLWDNGRIATSASGPTIVGALVGGNAGAHDVTLTGNKVFAQSSADQPRQDAMQPSYGVATYNMTISDNYVRAGETLDYALSIGATMTCTNNLFYGTASATAQTQCTGGAGNTFGTYTAGSNQVFQVWDDIYDPTWGHLVIDNIAGASSVNVTPACVAGEQVELRDAMDWDGAAVQTLTCGAGAQAVTMANAVTPNPPVGTVPNAPVNTGTSKRIFIMTKILGTAVEVVTATLPDATDDVAYSQTLTASGGVAPYTWDVTAGTLPVGTALSAGGVLSGTPTTAGTSNFTVRATDAMTVAGTRALSVVVVPVSSLAVATLTLTACPQNTDYSRQLEATGGVQPYTWTVSAGALPTGITLSSGGVLSGTCSGAVAVASFTARVADALASPSTRALTLSVLPNASPDIECTVQGKGKKKTLVCPVAGLPITQPLYASVDNGLDVVAYTNSGGQSTRYTLLGADTPLDVGTYTVTATVGTKSTTVDFTVVALSGTVDVVRRFAPLPGRGIANLLLAWGTDPSSLSMSSSVSCSAACAVTLSDVEHDSVYYFRHTWRDAMDAVVSQSKIREMLIP